MSTRIYLSLAAFSLSACTPFLAALSPKPKEPAVPPAPPITSPLHRANAGKIVFATEEIREDAQSATLIRQATLGEPLEVRAYFATTIAQTLFAKHNKKCDFTTISLKWEMRDARDNTWLRIPSDRDRNADWERTQTHEIVPLWGPEKTWPHIVSADGVIATFLETRQSTGPIPLELRVVVACELEDKRAVSATIAQGGVTVTLDPASVKAHLARTFRTPPHVFAHDDDFKIIESEARRTYETDGAKVLWVRVPQREWTIQREGLDVPYRRVNVTTGVRRGDKCMIKGAFAAADAIGGGRFVEIPELLISRSFPEVTEVPCSVL